jgi:hypothetical protein
MLPTPGLRSFQAIARNPRFEIHFSLSAQAKARHDVPVTEFRLSRKCPTHKNSSRNDDAAGAINQP